jgi:hypothetical protein
MKKKKHGKEYISCLASNFEQPIAVLVDRLLVVQLPDFPDDPPRNPEVDYAISLVILLVLTFEAWMSRARYFDKRLHAQKNGKAFVLPWMKSLNDPKLQPIIDSLSEIYFLRDAIVHNHVWTYTQSWAQGRAHYSNFNLDLTWQSKPSRINNIVKGKLPLPSFPRTKKLNLVVVPTFVSRREVAAVFKTVKDALKILDELKYVKIVPEVPEGPYVRFGGKLSFPFWSLIGRIQSSFIVQKN